MGIINRENETRKIKYIFSKQNAQDGRNIVFFYSSFH